MKYLQIVSAVLETKTKLDMESGIRLYKWEQIHDALWWVLHSEIIPLQPDCNLPTKSGHKRASQIYAGENKTCLVAIPPTHSILQCFFICMYSCLT